MKRAVAILVVVFSAVVLTGIVLQLTFWIAVFQWMVGFGVQTIHLDAALARGLAWLAVAAVSLVPIWALLKPSRVLAFFFFAVIGIAGIVGWYTNRDNLFTRNGLAVRYVAITNGGLIFSAHPGVDPKTGAVLQPVTEETAPLVALWIKTGGLPPLQHEPCSPAFSALTGQALCWFEKTSNGILFSRLPGYSPLDGQRLLPVTHSVIARWEQLRQIAESIERVHDSPIFKALRVSLAVPQGAATSYVGSDPAAGADELPVGTGISVQVKFIPILPESLGPDRLTAASLAVHSALSVFPGQPIFFRVPEEVDAPSGKAVIPAGSVAEGYVAVNQDPGDGKLLFVSVTTFRLFLPRWRRPIPLAAHLDPSCATPLMNFEPCALTLDAAFRP